MCADLENDSDYFGRKKVLEVGNMGVKIGVKVFVCGGEVGEKDALAYWTRAD